MNTKTHPKNKPKPAGAAMSVDGIDKIFEATLQHAHKSNLLNTAENQSKLSDADRQLQNNIGRVILTSVDSASLLKEAASTAAAPPLTDKACMDRFGKTLKACLRERINQLRTASKEMAASDPQKLLAPARKWLQDSLAQQPETWPERCKRALSVEFGELCDRKLQDPDNAKPEDAVLAAQADIVRAEALAALAKTKKDMPIDQQFKSWLSMKPGEAQQQIEDRMLSEKPNADPISIRQAAKSEVNKMVRKQTSKWAQFFKDDKMVRMLQRFESIGDKEARFILEKYLDYKVRLESRTDAERQQRSEDTASLLLSRDAARQETVRQRKRVHELISQAGGPERVPLGEDDYVPSDVGHTPLNQVVKRETSELTGAVVHKNTQDEPLSKRTQGAVQFLRAYMTDKSDSDAAVHQRLTERLCFLAHEAVSLHIKFMQVAKPSSLFVGTGRKPSGNTFEDLIDLLYSTGGAAQFDGNSIVRYLAEWQRCLIESRIDVDNAVARRHKEYDAALVQSVMSELGLSREEVEANFAFGVDPETSEVMRNICWAARSDWFRQSDSQADKRYHHADTAERVERRAKRRRRSEASGDVNQGSGKQNKGSDSGAGSHSQSRTREELEASDDEAAAGSGVEFSLNIEKHFKDMVLHSRAARRMPVLGAEYLADFMRKGLGEEHGERDCRNGTSCYCATKSSPYPFVDEGRRRGKSFVCRELLMPAELNAWKVSHELPQRRSFCVFCEMKIVEDEYNRCMSECVTPIKPLHRWAVRIGPGHYNPSCMLQIAVADRWTGIVRPFLRFNANNYTYGETRVGAVTLPCMRQTDRLDFRLTSNRRMRI